MVPKKRKSKRRTIHQQYTARKLYFERKRKAKKQAKRALKAGKVIPKRRDPGIPNSWPFKEEMLQEIQDLKESEERQKEEARELRKLQRMKEEAIARGEEFSEEEYSEVDEDPGNIPNGDNASVLTHIINNSDVILEVVDARDPINSRCFSVEKAIAEEMPEKVMIIVLNKIDLVPRPILEKTIASLSQQFPVVCWMNRTIAPSKKHDPFATRYMEITANHRDESYRKFTFGPTYLMQLLQQIQQSRGEMISVGVVGYPRVGRHSVIHTLCESSACYQADRQAYDDLNQLRRIDPNIHFFTRPGEVVLLKREPQVSDYLYKCYARGFEGTTYRSVCEDILSVCDRKTICYYYHTSFYNTVDEWIEELNEKVRNKKYRSNTGAARQFIQDWYTNALPHYAKPETCAFTTISKEQLKAWKKEMGYEQVKQAMMTNSMLDRVCSPIVKRVIETPNIQPTEETLDMSCFLPAADKEEMEEEEMEEEEEVPELVDVDDEELLA